MRKLVLASTSPRRKQILEQIGLSFRVAKSNVVEKLNPRLTPKGQAEDLSRQKAEAVAKRFVDAVILGADQVISLDNETFGKPQGTMDAKRMLFRMQGRQHSVITAFTIIDTTMKKSVTKSVETKVTMKHMNKRDIEWYVGTKEPFGRAGAYSIQGIGAVFIEKIEGDYFNVVGLPIATVFDELKKFNIL